MDIVFCWPEHGNGSGVAKLALLVESLKKPLFYNIDIESERIEEQEYVQF